MAKWEYRVSEWRTENGSFKSWLNALGSGGWELIKADWKQCCYCIFKRKIED